MSDLPAGAAVAFVLFCLDVLLLVLILRRRAPDIEDADEDAPDDARGDEGH